MQNGHTWGSWIKLAALSIALGLVGMALLTGERKKPGPERRTWVVALAAVLLVLGALAGLCGGPLWSPRG